MKSTIRGVELDLGRYELRRMGRPVKLEKKPMELLIFLVGRREQLVTRKDIVTKLWRSDLFIDTETNINNVVRKIRTALGDDSAKPRFLETVVGKGYRFIGPVRVIDARHPQSNAEQNSAAHLEYGHRLDERSSLAVLPLVLLGNITDDQGLSLGFADALVTRLGNLEGVDVLPTSAVMNVPAGAAPSDVALRLGVRFVVHGGMRVSKGQWQLSVKMFDAHLQSGCFARNRIVEESCPSELDDEIAKQIAVTLKRPLRPAVAQSRPRYSKDPMAYAEFMRGFRLGSSGDPAQLEEAIQRLSNAIARDPAFSLAHAALSLACASRHFEMDPVRMWLEKAEFHCQRALECDPNLPEGHVAKAYLLWGPSKNFQHLEAIAELKHALALQNNLPQAYSRLATILAHIGLLEHAREMHERGRAFHPKKKISRSIVQVYIWNREYGRAREEVQSWRTVSPGNKYAIYFAAKLAMMAGDWKGTEALLDEAEQLIAHDPLIFSLRGLLHALTGKTEPALECISRACTSPKSFGHAHHTYYQVARSFAVLGRREDGFAWLERSVSTGFACWPFFLADPYLQNLRNLPEFEVLISSLQVKYPDHLGLL